MTDRDKHGLRGPVRLVVTQRQTDDGPLIQEQAFDPEGAFANPCDGNADIVRCADGGRIEVEWIAGADSWSTEGLNGAGFGTKGATTAETKFDHRGAPVETVFRSAQGDEFSKVSYSCDAQGRIIDAVQCLGAAPPQPPRISQWASKASPAEKASARAFIEPGVEQFRVSFRSDEMGRVVEQATYFAGQILDHTVNEYNEHGDILTSTSDNKPQVQFEYEYDEYGNWTRKSARYALGMDEYRRTITYYEC